MAYKLICTVPLHGHRIGQEVTDQAAVERLLASHDHHFVKVNYDGAEPVGGSIDDFLESPAPAHSAE